MATRIYLPNTGATDINPTFGTYTETTGADRIKAVTSRISSVMTSKTQAHTATAANSTFLSRQYVIGPLAGQTYAASTVKGTIRVLESAANDNLDAMRLAIRVVAPDGTTFRTNILSQTNSTVAEFNTSLRAKRLATGGATVQSVITEGDYLVIEIATTSTVGGTSLSDTISYGDNSATDLGDNETDTAANNPFIELTGNIKFLQRGYGQAQAKISPGRGISYGQTQTLIDSRRTYAQANALINGTITSVLDTFTRSITDGLGSADTGGTYTITGSAAAWDINGSQATLASTSNGNYIGALNNTLIGRNGIAVKIQFAADSLVSVTQIFYFNVSVNLGSADTAGGGLDVLTLSIQLDDTNIGVGYTLRGSGSSYGVPYVVNDLYNFVGLFVRSSENQLRFRAKLWKVGDVEPGWLLSGIDIQAFPPPGHVAIGGNNGTFSPSPITVTFDNLQIFEASGSESGQAQAAIKAAGRGFGQAQTYILPRVGLAQANALVGGTYTSVVDTFTRSVSNGLGTADVGGTYTSLQSETNWNVTGTQATYLIPNSVFRQEALNSALIGPNVAVRFTISADTLPSSGNTTFSVFVNLGSATTLAFGSETSFGLTFISTGITARNSVLGNQGASGAIQGYTSGDTYQVVGLVAKTSGNRIRLRAKYWKVSTVEPEWNDIEVDPASYLPALFAPGHVILGNLGDAVSPSITVTIDDLEVINAAWTESGQAQAYIKVTSRGYGQAQTDIKAQNRGFGQALALIPNWFFGQANAVITTNQYIVIDTFTRTIGSGAGTPDTGPTYIDASGATVSVNGSNLIASAASSQQLNLQLPTVTPTRQYQGKIRFRFNDVTSGSFASQLSLYTMAGGRVTGLALVTARPAGTSSAEPRLVGQGAAHAVVVSTAIWYQAEVQVNSADIYRGTVRVRVWAVGDSEPGWFTITTTTPAGRELYYFSGPAIFYDNTDAPVEVDLDDLTFSPIGWTESGQAQAKIAVVGATTSRGYAQSQADIKAVGQGFAQSQADIKATNFGLGQANSDIKAVGNGLGQSQADIKATGNGLGQAQADVKATSFGLGQAQADIKAVGNGLGQSNADIKQTNNGLGQAQATIRGNALGQAQSDIKVTQNSFAQSQADVKAVGSGLGQSQADIKATNFGLGQSQADIKTTNSGSGQSQADIKTIGQGFGQVQSDIQVTQSQFAQTQADIKATNSAFAQTQADIKAINYGFGQAQSDIKTKGNGFGQAQSDIKAVNSGLGQTQADIQVTTSQSAQAQADIKQIYTQPAQAQADVKVTSFGSGQAQADIKATYSQVAQSQADVKATNSGFGQAQCTVKGNAFGQSQTDVRQTYWGSGQSQADIRATYFGLGQANASILGAVQEFAQAQADIITPEFASGNTQTDIKTTYTAFGQAQASIVRTFSGSGQAQATIVGNAFGQTQADIKQVYTQVAQSQADIQVTFSQVAQAQADIKQVTSGFAQAQADIKSTNNGFGQANTDVQVTTSQVAQSQADVRQTYNSFGQAQADIKTTGFAFGQAQADIRALQNNSSQAQADIKATLQAFGQSQADILVVTNAFSQAQADIKQTYQAWAQAQADIVTSYIGSAQSQADIKATEFGSGQAQVDIKATENQFGQANSDIKQTYSSCAQAQADIRSTQTGSGQANSDIKSVNNGFAQAQSDIKAINYGWAQVNSDIKTTEYGSGQAQTSILIGTQGHGQSNADIKAVNQGSGQTQSDIKQTGYGSGQSNAYIRVTSQGFGQAQGSIHVVTQGSGQANTDILRSNTTFGQSQADIRATSTVSAQAQADIKSTQYASAQAQAYVKLVVKTFGQAQADIKQVSTRSAQALADILSTATRSANAQALIRTTVIVVAQAEALIRTNRTGSGLAQANIQSGFAAHGQAQGIIAILGNVFAQAQAYIIKASVFAQAQGYTRQLHQLKKLVIADRIIIGLILSDRELLGLGEVEGNIGLEISDQIRASLLLSDRERPALSLADVEY